MFDGVAAHYDRTNTVMTFGQDRLWRRTTREALELDPGQRVLDLAAGTGVSTAELARSGAYAVGVDFSLGMLRAGQQRRDVRDTGLSLLAGDALRLPFADESFDAVTIFFGLRNVSDVDGALREMARVTRPGGRLAVCEASTPTSAPLRFGHLSFLMRVLPPVARAVSSNPDAYVYLAESIRAWPDQRRLATMITDAGWRNVQWHNLLFGAAAIHRARKPAARLVHPLGPDGPPGAG